MDEAILDRMGIARTDAASGPAETITFWMGRNPEGESP